MHARPVASSKLQDILLGQTPRGAGFRQPLILKEWEEVKPIIWQLNPSASLEFLQEIPVPTHLL